MLIEKPHKDNCELIPIIRPLLIREQQRGATRLALSKVSSDDRVKSNWDYMPFRA